MAFHGAASVLQGTPWHSMELHDIPWNFMAFHGTPSLLHGTPWNSMDTPWNSMAFHGTPWILYGYSMEVPWNSMDFHRFPWISMEFHGGISHGVVARSFWGLHSKCAYKTSVKDTNNKPPTRIIITRLPTSNSPIAWAY